MVFRFEPKRVSGSNSKILLVCPCDFDTVGAVILLMAVCAGSFNWWNSGSIGGICCVRAVGERAEAGATDLAK